jgi:uncharacterized protein YdeI (YjbR/CyaY-like superfamily)
LIPVSAENRKSAGLAAGDEVDVDIEVDTEPREVTVPPDFAEALDRQPDARRSFDGLSYSHKLRHVLSIEDAKPSRHGSDGSTKRLATCGRAARSRTHRWR